MITRLLIWLDWLYVNTCMKQSRMKGYTTLETVMYPVNEERLKLQGYVVYRRKIREHKDLYRVELNMDNKEKRDA